MNNDYIFEQLDIEPKKIQCEAEINGQRISYDGCSHSKNVTLEEAKEYYKRIGLDYIGSSRIAYYNGVRNDYDVHFFKRLTPDYTDADKAEVNSVEH